MQVNKKLISNCMSSHHHPLMMSGDQDDIPNSIQNKDDSNGSNLTPPSGSSSRPTQENEGSSDWKSESLTIDIVESGREGNSDRASKNRVSTSNRFNIDNGGDDNGDDGGGDDGPSLIIPNPLFPSSSSVNNNNNRNHNSMNNSNNSNNLLASSAGRNASNFSSPGSNPNMIRNHHRIRSNVAQNLLIGSTANSTTYSYWLVCLLSIFDFLAGLFCVIIFGLTIQDSCDVPLKWFLVLYGITCFFQIPLLLLKHLLIPNWTSFLFQESDANSSEEIPSSSDQATDPSIINHNNNNNVEAVANNNNNNNASNPSFFGGNGGGTSESLTGLMFPNDPITVRWGPYISFQLSSTQISDIKTSSEKFLNFIGFFIMSWYVVGNFWLFSSNTCHSTSPLLFNSTLALVVLGYMSVLSPIILCVAVLLCFPCVIVLLRRMEKPQPGRGATQEMLKKLPIFIWDPSTMVINNNVQDIETGIPPVQQDSEDSLGVNKTSGGFSAFISNLFGRHSPRTGGAEQQPGSYASLHDNTDISHGSQEDNDNHPTPFVINAEDASCTICLSEYVPLDEIRRLPCRHHFHRKCVDEWLLINKTCPLCVQPIATEMAASSSADPASSVSPTSNNNNNDDEARVRDLILRLDRHTESRDNAQEERLAEAIEIATELGLIGENDGTGSGRRIV